MFTPRLFWTVAAVVLSIALVTEGLRMTNGPKKCCFSFARKQIARAQVVNYKMTSKQCFTPGVIFFTQRGFQVCANPTASWVQAYMKSLDNSRSKSNAKPLKQQ